MLHSWFISGLQTVQKFKIPRQATTSTRQRCQRLYSITRYRAFSDSYTLFIMSFSPSNASTTTSSIIYTPRGDSIAIGDLYLRDDPSDAVPWPGNTYVIQDKASGRSITAWKGQIYLKKPSAPNADTAHWLCVEADGYFGFFNKRTNCYIGFQDNGLGLKRLVLAPEFGEKERFLPRRHPDGGYQLLSPAGDGTLKQVAALSDSEILVTRQHAGVIWEFVLVTE
ncbi:hypothetical protein H0G86_001577 [Trichoderma simmonsii]|uniref:Uncharacterized protein n=1 Tax=Trichoderma simmonsii TaxID=1491479 RepID=A0A8G0L1V5_9HYPO|nr:hypothetical protein H0G86_001577 [Trichoderma simmonsii]